MGDRADARRPRHRPGPAPFYERFRFDPLIGAAVRAHPGLRPHGRPDPFEALAWTVCEQLIEYERAAAIQRRLVARLGRRCPVTGLADSPSAAVLAGPGAGAARVLRAHRDPGAWRWSRWRARSPPGAWTCRTPTTSAGGGGCAAIRGVGSWTLETLALTGQGRLDQLPAGDLAYLKLVGRLQSAPIRARAPPRRRSASCSRPTRRGRGWPGCTPCTARAAPRRCASPPDPRL